MRKQSEPTLGRPSVQPPWTTQIIYADLFSLWLHSGDKAMIQGCLTFPGLLFDVSTLNRAFVSPHGALSRGQRARSER